MNWLKRKIQNWLGITELQQQIYRLKNTNESIVERHRRLEDVCESISKDNKTIINHVKLINKDFTVGVDIGYGKDDSTVIILRRDLKGDIIKTYNFPRSTAEEVYRFIEGFSRQNTYVDKPRHFTPPKFRL